MQGDIITAAGTRFYIGPAASAAIDSTAEFDAMDWTEVGLVETYGELGDEAGTVTFAAVNDGRQRKAKGIRDAGDFTVTCGYDPSDEGQQALDAAEGTNRAYAFKLVLPDRLDETGTDSIQYFRALVMSRRSPIGGGDTVVTKTYTLAVTSQVYRVEPTAGAVAP